MQSSAKCNFQILTGCSVEPRVTVENFVAILKRLRRYVGLKNFKINTVRHFDFKNQFFNFSQGADLCLASSCKISSRQLRRLRRYCNFIFFQIDGCPPSWICKNWILNFYYIGCGLPWCITMQNFFVMALTSAEIQLLKLFKMADVRHLGFVKIQLLSISSTLQTAAQHHLAKFYRN